MKGADTCRHLCDRNVSIDPSIRSLIFPKPMPVGVDLTIRSAISLSLRNRPSFQSRSPEGPEECFCVAFVMLVLRLVVRSIDLPCWIFFIGKWCACACVSRKMVYDMVAPILYFGYRDIFESKLYCRVCEGIKVTYLLRRRLRFFFFQQMLGKISSCTRVVSPSL